jgi:hypothetical protein
MSEQRPCVIMGKEIGTETGWDILDNWAMLVCTFQPNTLGQQFVPDFVGPRDLAINFDDGTVSIHDTEGNQTLLRTDWSVFNRTEQATGWQAPKGE